jgi:hypothetical protein
MKFSLLSLFLLFKALVTNSQDINEYQAIDKIVMEIPYSQTNTTDDIASYINNHFDAENKKIRAAYAWVGANIKYNKDSVYRVILNEDREKKVTYALKRRSGVCENFAAIFSDICTKCGIKSFVIEGYTRQDGFVNKSGHVWCGAFINNNWFLYDPTWDASLVNTGMLINHVRSDYFQISPADFIQTHMPYDPLFQFLNYPISYKEFSNDNTAPVNHKIYFNYEDSIAVYEKQNSLEQYNASILRIESTGAPVSFIDTKMKQLKMEKEVIYQDKDVDLYNGAVSDYKEAMTDFKTFINYRNNQFLPAKSNDEIEAMLKMVEKKIVSAKIKLNEVDSSKATLVLNTGDVEKILEDLSAHVTEQRDFVKNYFSSPTGK